MYVSFDDGKSWNAFQMNLPVVPITDLALKNDDLIVATQGRSFWILDDLTLLHQLDEKKLKADVVMFQPRPATKTRSGRGRPSLQNGQNPDSGVKLSFMMREALEPKQVATLVIEDAEGKAIQAFSTKPEKGSGQQPLKIKQGHNEFLWNMRYPDAESFTGLVLWAGGTRGPAAIPGTYSAKLTIADKSYSTKFQIVKDPRSPASDADFKAQLDFLLKLRDKLTETHVAIKKIRETRTQINSLVARIKKQADSEAKKKSFKPIFDSAEAVNKKMTEIEEKLYQTKNQSPQDPLNFPIRLNNKLSALAGVVSTGDYPPTQQAVAVYTEISGKIDAELKKLSAIFASDVNKLNALIQKQKVPAIFVGDK